MNKIIFKATANTVKEITTLIVKANANHVDFRPVTIIKLIRR